MRPVCLPVLVLALLALAGCGGEEETRAPAPAVAEISDARDLIRALCREGAPRAQGLRDAVDDLLEVVRQYPDRTVQGEGFDRRRTVAEEALRAAENLDRCGADRLAARIRAEVDRVS